uniref:Variant surface glycoprotein 1125.1525 n=1 Tax=Trypanosoma brucei TaxID=5691 RepID=A0A1J0R4M9_9TRYP|nr:variant surface glycoprotein 1125.1525 [Trypanosoma brucei]
MKFLLMQIATVGLAFIRHASAAAGDAQAEFLALCDAWRVASKGQLPAFKAPADDTNYLEILYYNASIADDKWKALLDTPNPEGKWDKMKETLKAADNKLDWEHKWESWRDQRQHTKDATIGKWLHKNPLKQSGPLIASSRHVIQKIAERAAAINDELKKAPTADGTDLISAGNIALQHAMCGIENDFKYDSKTSACTAVGKALNKDTDCAKAKNGLALGHDIVCVCSDTTDAACGPDATNTKAIGDGAGDRIKDTTDLCPNRADVTDLAAETAVALATIQGLIARKKGSSTTTILGASTG